MKTMIFVITAFLSVPAFADYFGCDLKVGNEHPVTVEAEYRGRSVEVLNKNWSCAGNMANDGLVTLTLTSLEPSEVSKTVTGHLSVETTLAVQYDGDDVVKASCLCSLR